MFCRSLQVVARGLVGTLLLAVILFGSAGEVWADDFRLLLVRETGFDPAQGMPSGRLVVKAGYLDGVEAGQSGVIWRKNKFKGRLEIADFEVIDVAPYESYCIYTMRYPDFQVTKKDRVSLETSEHTEADILAHAIAALDTGRCFDALLYFERIYCNNRENGFVLGQVQECQRRVEKRLTTGNGEISKSDRGNMWEQLEVAEGFHKYKNDLAADLYLKCVLATDSTNLTAVKLRKEVPVQDYSYLLSPERCE